MPTPTIPVSRPQATVMLSRVAHSLYWLSRYIERAENITRLLEVNLQFLLDFQDIEDESLKDHWHSLIASSGNRSLFESLYSAADSQSVTSFFAFDLRNPSSILACIYAARENARMIRDQISAEMWEAINELYLFLKARNAAEVWAAGPHEFFEHIKRHSHLFQGLTDSTYPRSEGWEFVQFGKFIERAEMTTRILDVKYHILLPDVTDVGGAVDTAQWQAVLRSASALDAYRRFYVREILAWKVAEFLIFSDSFPRSLHYCTAQLDELLRRILGDDGPRARTAAVRDYLDYYGNRVHYFDLSGAHDRLVIEAESEVETVPDAVRPPRSDVTSPGRPGAPAPSELHAEFLADSHYVNLGVELRHEVKEYFDRHPRTGMWAEACALGRHVFETFTYRPYSTGVNTVATEALRQRTGVCQDYAHVMLGLCRAAGLPARYVSGYFLNIERRPDESEASHAWVEVHLPGQGWIGYDPTHARPADERYVKLAAGRDYSDIRPVSGTYRGAPTKELRVDVAVREHEKERVVSNAL
ncbi:MAG TPA: alpha-E domain-containing protein [Opitutus sp.]|nr:alpha-E domain-containing protein [Opitutus sp.]